MLSGWSTFIAYDTKINFKYRGEYFLQFDAIFELVAPNEAIMNR